MPDLKVREELYEYLETYIMRRFIARATTKNYNQLFSERLISNRILSRQALIEYLAKQDETVNFLPSDENLYHAFSHSVFTNKQSSGILYMLESKIRDSQKHSTALLGISQYSVEHLMPKKWQNHWGMLDTEEAVSKRNNKLLMLGNLAIIPQSLNASIRDADWQTKKEGNNNKPGLKKYGEGLETLSPYLDFSEWDENTIDKRSEDLCKKASEAWYVQ